MKDFATNAFDTMLEHSRSRTDIEVGGFLVGTLTETSSEVVVALPASAASAASANVTFTHEVWDDALRSIESNYPELRIVGWYHTHPRFGVFMSEYDQFIQNNFFSDPRLRGLVIDPIAGTGGVFISKNGVVEQTESFEIEPIKDDVTERNEKIIERRKSRGLIVVLAPAVLLLALLGGYLLGTTSTPATKVIRTTEVRSAHFTADGCEVSAYVTAGSSYWSLAQILLHSGSQYLELKSENGGRNLYPGEIIHAIVPNSLCTARLTNNG